MPDLRLIDHQGCIQSRLFSICHSWSPGHWIATIYPIHFYIMGQVQQFLVFEMHLIKKFECRSYVRTFIKWTTPTVKDNRFGFWCCLQHLLQLVQVLLLAGWTNINWILNDGRRPILNIKGWCDWELFKVIVRSCESSSCSFVHGSFCWVLKLTSTGGSIPSVRSTTCSVNNFTFITIKTIDKGCYAMAHRLAPASNSAGVYPSKEPFLFKEAMVR